MEGIFQATPLSHMSFFYIPWKYYLKKIRMFLEGLLICIVLNQKVSEGIAVQRAWADISGINNSLYWNMADSLKKVAET